MTVRNLIDFLDGINDKELEVRIAEEIEDVLHDPQEVKGSAIIDWHDERGMFIEKYVVLHG